MQAGTPLLWLFPALETSCPGNLALCSGKDIRSNSDARSVARLGRCADGAAGHKPGEEVPEKGEALSIFL